MRDHYALNRNHLTGEPLKEVPIWMPIDYALAETMQMITDYTDNQSGHFVKDEQSPKVSFRAVRKIRKSQAAIDAKTSGKNYKEVPGGYWITEVVGEPPTWREWFDSLDKPVSNNDENGSEMSKFQYREVNEDDDGKIRPAAPKLPDGWVPGSREDFD